MPSKTTSKERVTPTDVLCASFVLDPRYNELFGEVMRECVTWVAPTPEVALGLLQGVHKTFQHLEERGKFKAYQMLKPPTEIPEGFDAPDSPDPDGMDA